MSKIYEFRIYTMNILADVEFFKLLSNDRFWKRLNQYVKVVGFWRTELNGLHQYVYVLDYDDIDQVFRVREGMEKDDEWKSMFASLVDLKVHFTNVLTVPAEGTKVVTNFAASKTAVYEFQQVPEGTQPPNGIAANATVVGRFSSVYGPSQTEYRLIRYPDRVSAFNDAVRNRKALPAGADTRILVPLPMSPAQ